jgi:hypothetical protein
LRDYLNRPAQFLAIVVQFALIAVVVGGFGVYDAPEQWGPWTRAFYTDAWNVGLGESASSSLLAHRNAVRHHFAAISLKHPQLLLPKTKKTRFFPEPCGLSTRSKLAGSPLVGSLRLRVAFCQRLPQEGFTRENCYACPNRAK